MTDISKYKNVSLAKDTYLNLDKIRKILLHTLLRVEVEQLIF